MKKYLIFGATGSIGSKLAEQLYNSNKNVHLIGRDEENHLWCSSNKLKTLSYDSRLDIIYKIDRQVFE